MFAYEVPIKSKKKYLPPSPYKAQQQYITTYMSDVKDLFVEPILIFRSSF